jgi:flavin-dependent dehydrogenase
VVSTFLAQKGYRVVMIEREQFPRFHIGESLLPATQEIWERLGIAQEMEHSGHTFKYAGSFFVAANPNSDKTLCTTTWSYNFPRKFMNPRQYAYHVERAVFDKQLQDNAVRHGVTLWDNTNVEQVLFEGDRAVGLRLRRDGEASQELHFPFIVDASGRRCLIARQFDCVEQDPEIKTSGVFSHFRGVKRAPGYRQGFFNGYFIENGWIWMIPLANDIMSVGMIQNEPANLAWSNNPEEVLLDAINRYKVIRDRFTNAVQVGRIRRLKDLAYQTTTFCGDGWLSIGDANFFVDPLYSSGVQIAHTTAEQAAENIDEFLKGGRDMRAIRKYEKYIKNYRKRVFRPMRCFYRCMRHYKAIAGYVKSTGEWFKHFDNWFLRRACCWGTGRFHRHQWVIDLMTLNGNLSAWGAPLIGYGGWPRYEQRPFTGPALNIPKAPELTTLSEHDAEHVPITVRMALQSLPAHAPSKDNGNGATQPAPEAAREPAGTH